MLNSAPPDAPKVLYVVPAFKWDPDVKSGSKTTSARHGGMVRVYMDRPWFSSGDGELLGVATAWNASQAGSLKDNVMSVMARPFQQAPPGYVAAAQHTVRHPVGTGPGVSRSASMTFAPTYKAFPLAAAAAGGITATNQKLLENGGLPVAISGHAVNFDGGINSDGTPKGRQLWYSDIQMNFGDSYYPFVRLALVRYQPNSINGAFVSRMVMADFVQLAPDRVATVTSGIDAGDQRKIGVTVVGIGPINPVNGHFKNELVVTVETQQPSVKGDLAWLPVPNSAYEMSGQPGEWKQHAVLLERHDHPAPSRRHAALPARLQGVRDLHHLGSRCKHPHYPGHSSMPIRWTCRGHDYDKSFLHPSPPAPRCAPGRSHLAPGSARSGQCRWAPFCKCASIPRACTHDIASSYTESAVNRIVNTAADLAAPCTTKVNNVVQESLRCAISDANIDGSGDTISFNIPSNAPGCTNSVCVISPTSPLPALTASTTTIDGYSDLDRRLTRRRSPRITQLST